MGGTLLRAEARGFVAARPGTDVVPRDRLPLDELLERCDVISLHCPLIHETYHLINADTLQYLKPGAMLINTSKKSEIFFILFPL